MRATRDSARGGNSERSARIDRLVHPRHHDHRRPPVATEGDAGMKDSVFEKLLLIIVPVILFAWFGFLAWMVYKVVTWLTA